MYYIVLVIIPFILLSITKYDDISINAIHNNSFCAFLDNIITCDQPNLREIGHSTVVSISAKYPNQILYL